jgi:hypothetical protein
MRLLFLHLLLYPIQLNGQLNEELKRKIDSLKIEDQKWRNLITEFNNGKMNGFGKDELANKMIETDSLNFIVAKSIFDMHGFPGFDKVGKESSHNFWLIIQHQDRNINFQEEVLHKMGIEVKKGNAGAGDYAYFIDRVKVNQGMLQVYGTQMDINADSTSYEPKPVIDPDQLDARRKEVFLPPIAKYISIMNERYFGTLKKKD